MKITLKQFSFVAVSLLFFGLLASCQKEESPNYLSSVPTDAVNVVKIDLTSIVNKSEMMNNPMISTFLTETLRQSCPTDLQSFVDKIVADPSNSGIDFKKPIVMGLMGSSADSYFILLPVLNADAVEESVDVLVKMYPSLVKNYSGSELELSTDTWVMKSNASRLILIGETQSSASINILRTLATTLLNQPQGLLEQPGFQAFEQADKDIAIWMNMGSAGELHQTVTPNINLSLYNGSSSLYTINFESGRVACEGESFLTDSLKAFVESSYATPDGRFLNLMPQNSWMVCNVALKNIGNVLHPILGEVFDPTLEEIGLNTLSFNDLDGDFMMGIADGLSAQDMPTLSMAAQLKNRNLFDILAQSGLADGIFTPIGTDAYAISAIQMEGFNYQFLYRDNAMYLLPVIDRGAICPNYQPSIVDNRFSATLKHNAFVLDIAAICQSPYFVQLCDNRNMSSLLTSFSMIDYIDGQMDSMTQSHGGIYMRDKNRNALVSLIAMATALSMNMQ